MSEVKQNTNLPATDAQPSNSYMEIDLVEYLYRLLVNLKWVIFTTVLGALVAMAYTIYCVTPLYKATATIYVISPTDSAINLSDLNLGSALTQDYIKCFDMWEVQEEVITNLGLDMSYSQLRNMVSVSNTSGTRMLDITVTSSDPEFAAKLANEYAAVGSKFIAETMSTDKPNMMSVALTPTSPVSPNISSNTILGGVAGAVLSCGLIFVIMLFDDKIRTAEEIRKYTGLVTLSVIPMENGAKNAAKGSGHHSKSGKKGQLGRGRA